MGTKVKSWIGAMNYRYKSRWPKSKRLSQKEIKAWWEKVKDVRWSPYQAYQVFQGRAE